MSEGSPEASETLEDRPLMDDSGELRKPRHIRRVYEEEASHMIEGDSNAQNSRIHGVRQHATPAAIATAAVVAGFVAFQRFWKRRKQGSVTALMENNLELPQAADLEEPAKLSGLRFCCSALFDVKGACTRYSDDTSPSSSAESIVALMDAGATLVGRTITEELSLGLLGDAEEASNPAAPECSISGCGCGPALMVASGRADIGLGTDHVSGIRVQSCIFGLSGFRPTHGELSSRGMARVTGSFDSPSWLVRDPGLHPKIAESLKLPGGRAAFNNTELLQLVVASEVFELLGDTGRRLKAVAMSAAKKWAGPEQAASGLLITYLEKNVLSAKSFLAEKDDDGDILEGIRRAAATLQHNALLQEYGHLLEEPENLRPDVLESLNNAQNVSEEDLAEAERVAGETKQAMKSILKGVILILPSLPFPQPAQGSNETQLKDWEKGTLKLAALATLTGCPQATLPVLQGPGKPPLGLALFSLPKTDQRLAHVTAALAPLIEFAADEKNIARSNNSPIARKKAGILKANAQRQEQFEAAKLAGNEAFKNGKYQEAIKEYTIGIDLNGKKHPLSCVLHSNRALCYIKVGLYQEAEEDGTAALSAGPNAKALLRRGTARSLMFKHQEAIQDFRHVLSLEPNNRQARKELNSLLELGGESYGNGGSTARSNVGTDRSSLA